MLSYWNPHAGGWKRPRPLTSLHPAVQFHPRDPTLHVVCRRDEHHSHAGEVGPESIVHETHIAELHDGVFSRTIVRLAHHGSYGHALELLRLICDSYTLGGHQGRRPCIPLAWEGAPGGTAMPKG